MGKTAITDVITSLAAVESRFNLRQTQDGEFFREWQENLPEIDRGDQDALDLIRCRYLYHLRDGNLTEGTVTLLIGSPLLEKAGFYDEPFKIRGEASVEIALDGGNGEEEMLRGRIDVLVVQNRLWGILLESKGTTISVLAALPQTLAYMRANPQLEKPAFGMVTNGNEIMFVKLFHQEYDISRLFSPVPLHNELYTVLRILKYLAQIIRENEKDN